MIAPNEIFSFVFYQSSGVSHTDILPPFNTISLAVFVHTPKVFLHTNFTIYFLRSSSFIYITTLCFCLFITRPRSSSFVLSYIETTHKCLFPLSLTSYTLNSARIVEGKRGMSTPTVSSENVLMNILVSF